jgi:hypothetical protein
LETAPLVYLDSVFKNLAKASLHGAAGREFSPFAKKLFPNTQDFDPVVFASVLIHCDANKNGMFVNKIVSSEEAEIVYDGSGESAWNVAGKKAKNGQRVARETASPMNKRNTRCGPKGPHRRVRS